MLETDQAAPEESRSTDSRIVFPGLRVQIDRVFDSELADKHLDRHIETMRLVSNFEDCDMKPQERIVAYGHEVIEFRPLGQFEPPFPPDVREICDATNTFNKIGMYNYVLIYRQFSNVDFVYHMKRPHCYSLFSSNMAIVSFGAKLNVAIDAAGLKQRSFTIDHGEMMQVFIQDPSIVWSGIVSTLPTEKDGWKLIMIFMNHSPWPYLSDETPLMEQLSKNGVDLSVHHTADKNSDKISDENNVKSSDESSDESESTDESSSGSSTELSSNNEYDSGYDADDNNCHISQDLSQLYF